MKQAAGLYVHIPFCLKKCTYCDFLSFNSRDMQKRDPDCVEKYFEALSRELSRLASEDPGDPRTVPELFDTVYIGGGTPSAVPSEYICEIIKLVKENFNVSSDAEITVEANPGTVTEEKLAAYKESGINRVSLGVQSFDPDILKLAGRVHTPETACQAISLVSKYFDNFNLDFITGMPGFINRRPSDVRFRRNYRRQTLDDTKNCVNAVLASGAAHVSVYGLIVEEGTPFYKWCNKELLDLCEDDEERGMYYYFREKLLSAGYGQYEISNFALPGRESRHNLKYWSGNEYLGLGLGAVSFLNTSRGRDPVFPDGSGDGTFERFSNTRDLSEYERSGASQSLTERLDVNMRKNEYMLLGFRKTCGPDPVRYKELFGGQCDMDSDYHEQLGQLIEEGLIDRYAYADGINGYRLTEKGLDFANEIFMRFLDS